jgi:DNA-binding protein YbaB
MDFSALNKSAANSFNQQKSLIKMVLAGKKVKCNNCNTLISVHTGADSVMIKCEKDCTDIKLDAELLK